MHVYEIFTSQEKKSLKWLVRSWRGDLNIDFSKAYNLMQEVKLNLYQFTCTNDVVMRADDVDKFRKALIKRLIEIEREADLNLCVYDKKTPDPFGGDSYMHYVHYASREAARELLKIFGGEKNAI